MHEHKNLALIAMIFAVSMTFIDQTIVSIAVPIIEDDIDLSTTGGQWIVNGYMLALAITRSPSAASSPTCAATGAWS